MHTQRSYLYLINSGRKPISTTGGVHHRPHDAAAEGAKISSSGAGKLNEQNRLYVVAAFSGGALVFISIFIVACLLSLKPKPRRPDPIALSKNTTVTSPSQSDIGKHTFH